MRSFLASSLDNAGVPGRNVLVKNVVSRTREKLEGLCATTFNGYTYRVDVLLGKEDVPRELIQYAEAHNAAQIVISTHGRSGIGHLLLAVFVNVSSLFPPAQFW